MKCTSKKTESSTAEQERISAAVVELLRRQVADRGLVVWYDPQKAYGHLAARLTIPDCTVLRHEVGFFRLREQLEPFLECVNENGALKPDADIAPRVIVYVPMARTDTAYALIEAETAGIVVEPDAAAPERNSRLGRIVEEVFKEVAPAKAAHLARQAEDGLLTVDELDRMAGEAGSVAAGALQIVFGQVSAEEMLLQFTAQESNDAAPLHEVLPSWPDTRTAWKELEEGKYDWAHQAMAFWPDRVKATCLTNKSFAIAHGVAVPEDDAAADTPKRQGRKKKE